MVLHVESNLVEIGLSVRDQNSESAAGLQASDFEVFDNRAPQTNHGVLSELRREGRPSATPAAPRFITFFFELHMGGPGGSVFTLPAVKQAARAFATQFLKPGDRMSIAATYGLGVLLATSEAANDEQTIFAMISWNDVVLANFRKTM